MRAIFDIETIALPLAEIADMMPPFDEMTVKLGNLKDEGKIKEKVEERRTRHREKWIEDAALDARCARCKLAGFYSTHAFPAATSFCVFAHEEDPKAFARLEAAAAEVSEGVQLVCRRDERSFLNSVATAIVEIASEEDGQLITYFGHEFDLPFLARRAWIAGVPFGMRKLRRGRYFRDSIVDLYAEWNLGQKDPPKAGGLAGLAKLLGCAPKTGEGFQFGELYAKDPAEGLLYLLNDLRTTAECAERMGVL